MLWAPISELRRLNAVEEINERTKWGRSEIMTYLHIVAIGPISISPIRPYWTVTHFRLHIYQVIGRVTHGPASTVWYHVAVSLESVWMIPSIWVSKQHSI